MSGNLSTLSMNSLTATESAKPSDSTSSVPTESNIEDMIGQINELGTQLAKITNQIAQLMREYAAQQKPKQFEMKEAAMDAERNSIVSRYSSEAWAGGLKILSGFTEVGGIGATGKLGEGAARLGQAFGKGIDGAGATISASMTKDAEMEKLDGQFKQMSAQKYMETLTELVQKACQIMQQLNAVLKDFVELNGKLTSAVR